MTDYWQLATAHLSKKDKVLAKIISSYEGELLQPKNDAFYTLARAIVGQQISVKAADSVWSKLVRHSVERRNPAIKKMDPDFRRDDVEKITDEQLRACGLSSQKVNYMRSLAEYFSKPRDFTHMSDAEVIRELTSIKGIGSWTAEMFLIFHLARPDVFPIKDIGLQKAMFLHYHKGEKVALAELEKRSLRWQPYRSVATWYLWRSLDPVPVAY